MTQVKCGKAFSLTSEIITAPVSNKDPKTESFALTSVEISLFPNKLFILANIFIKIFDAFSLSARFIVFLEMSLTAFKAKFKAEVREPYEGLLESLSLEQARSSLETSSSVLFNLEQSISSDCTNCHSAFVSTEFVMRFVIH